MVEAAGESEVIIADDNLTIVEAAMQLESSTLECYPFARNSWVVVPIYQED